MIDNGHLCLDLSKEGFEQSNLENTVIIEGSCASMEK
jgi:hypothetical protein